MELRLRQLFEGFDGLHKLGLPIEVIPPQAAIYLTIRFPLVGKTTKEGKALYMHCLPADITGVSCKEGEVEASVFDRYRVPLYKEAGYKPYIIAAMMFLSKVKDPVATLKALSEGKKPRFFEK